MDSSKDVNRNTDLTRSLTTAEYKLVKDAEEEKKAHFEYLSLFEVGNKAGFGIKFKAYLQVLAESLPVCFSMVVLPLILMLTFNFLKGEISELQTVALGFANNYQCVFGQFPAYGIGEMVGINCSEAFGRKSRKRYWKFFYMGFTNVAIFFCFFSIPFLFFGGKILAQIGIDKNEAELAGNILKDLIGPTALIFINEVLKACLISQGIENPFFFINLGGFVLSMVTLKLCVHWKQGVDTLVINTYVFNAFQMVFYLLLIFKYSKIAHMFTGVKKGLLRFSKDCFSMIFNFLLEIISFHILTLIVGWTKDKAQISSYVFNTVCVDLFYQFNIAIAFGYRTRINFLIGKKKFKNAKTFAKFFIKNHVTLSIFASGVLLVASTWISYLFTNDKRTRHYTSNVMKFYCIGFLCDNMQPIIETTVRTLGNSKLLAVMQISLYGFSTSFLCYYLGIKLGYGAYGVAVGFASGRWVGFILSLTFIWLYDWSKVSRIEMAALPDKASLNKQSIAQTGSLSKLENGNN